MELIEKHIVTYSCSCKHEIGLPKEGGFWIPTGNNQDCEKHGKEKTN